MNFLSLCRFLFLFSMFGAINFAHGQTLCQQLDGAGIYGQDSEGTYLGFFGNRFALDSIYNTVGRYGSEFRSESVRNQYGEFGGRYSDTSANAPYAQKPPFIVKNGSIIGLLTANRYLSGAIALADIDANCTFTSSTALIGAATPPPPPTVPPPSNQPPVLVDSGFSGLWWNSSRSGEGLNLDFTLGSAQGSSLMLVAFYTYDPDGYPIFLTGAAQIGQSEDEATFAVGVTFGPKFGAEYNPADIVYFEVGAFHLKFNSCSSIDLSFVPNQAGEQSRFTGFQSSLTRFAPRQPWQTCLGIQ